VADLNCIADINCLCSFKWLWVSCKL